jgi:hypothetical protein
LGAACKSEADDDSHGDEKDRKLAHSAEESACAIIWPRRSIRRRSFVIVGLQRREGSMSLGCAKAVSHGRCRRSQEALLVRYELTRARLTDLDCLRAGGVACWRIASAGRCGRAPHASSA